MQAYLKPYKPDDKQDQAAKSAICRHLQKSMKRTIIIVIWHSQEPRRHIKPPVKLDL